MKKLLCRIFGHKMKFFFEKKTKYSEIFMYQCERCGFKDSITYGRNA